MKQSFAPFIMAIMISLFFISACSNTPPPTPTPTLEPTPENSIVDADATSEFNGKTYNSKATGYMTITPDGLPAFNGVLVGTQVVSNEVNENWKTIQSTKTNVRILEVKASEFLVEGTVEKYLSETVFLAPGAVIENALTNSETVSLVKPNGNGTYDLKFGEIVEVTSDGDFKPKG